MESNENFVLANIVFKMRASHLKIGSPNFKDNRKNVTEEYERVVQGIASVFLEAENGLEIELRPSFAESLSKEILTEPIAVITTNWDTLLDKHFKDRCPVEHLHCSVLDTNLMLLPSEVVIEKYRGRTFRKIMAQRHRRILDLLEHAEKVIVYGLSLDPLDAELNLIVGDSLRKDNQETKTGPKDVVVIDRKPDNVVNRLLHFDPTMKVRAVQV